MTKLRTLSFDSPIGTLRLMEREGTIILITRLDSSESESSDPFAQNPTELLFQARDELIEYLEGKRTDFTFPIRDIDSPFYVKVRQACRKIPYGSTVSYSELAAMAGNPGAFRAAATAMRMNHLPLVIPCHRVLPKDGSLGSYTFADGPKTKQWLLDLEARTISGSIE